MLACIDESVSLVLAVALLSTTDVVRRPPPAPSSLQALLQPCLQPDLPAASGLASLFDAETIRLKRIRCIEMQRAGNSTALATDWAYFQVYFQHRGYNWWFIQKQHKVHCICVVTSPQSHSTNCPWATPTPAGLLWGWDHVVRCFLLAGPPPLVPKKFVMLGCCGFCVCGACSAAELRGPPLAALPPLAG